jgi:NACHT domain
MPTTDRSRRPSWRLAALAGAIMLGTALLAIVTNLATPLLPASWTWVRTAWLMWPLAGLLVVTVVALTVWQVHSSAAPEAEPPRPPDPRLAADDLAAAVRRYWEKEAANRSLDKPDPLRLRWSTSGRSVQDHSSSIRGEPVSGRSSKLRLKGRLDEIVAAYTSLRYQRLVVLGKPGAGKSALAILLTLGLLECRQDGEPVPLLLTLSSWDPREHLEAWIIRQVARDYYMGRDETPRRLVAAGRILPILDGLDEIAATQRSEAIQELDRALGATRPLVVTCRSQEYEDAVAAGVRLARAAVIEIEAVKARDAVDY